MASKFQSEKPLESMMKNLRVNISSEAGKHSKTASKVGNPADATAYGHRPGGVMNGVKGDAGQENNYYSANGYYGYYYPGFDGSYGQSNDQGYHYGHEGVEMQYPVVQAENGQLVYYNPGVHFGYDPYNPYIPGAMVGMDGQYMTPQPYFPGAVLQQPLSPQVFSPSPVPYGTDMYPVYSWDYPPLVVDASNGNGLAGGLPVSVPMSNLPSSVHTLAATKSATTLKSSNSVNNDAKPLKEISSNLPMKAAEKISQHAYALPDSQALATGYFPVTKFQDKTGLHYAGGALNAKADDQPWLGPDKFKGRSKINRPVCFDWLNEQNRGPRTTGPKNLVTSTDDSAGLEVNANNVASITRNDQYNLPDFQTKYVHAIFYVIKSYSEDDVHKSIKYKVWASTSNGNRRLDNAYEVARKKVEEKGSKCPIFLFFSVNASGQFCGVAEMTGRVDFDKSMDFWQQDKWTGFFPVKWHIIKDVPNTQFRHIILENNENKPVTNSRDTQEVKFVQGTEMLSIFKNYSAKTSIIDDFGFYEGRQKMMQDKKIRPVTVYSEFLPRKSGGLVYVPQAGDKKVVPVGDPVDDATPVKDGESNLVTPKKDGELNSVTVEKDGELNLVAVKKDVELNAELKE